MWYPDDVQHLQSLSVQVSRRVLRLVQGLRHLVQGLDTSERQVHA